MAKVGDSHYTKMVSFSFSSTSPTCRTQLHKNYNSVSSTATVNTKNNIALTVSWLLHTLKHTSSPVSGKREKLVQLHSVNSSPYCTCSSEGAHWKSVVSRPLEKCRFRCGKTKCLKTPEDIHRDSRAVVCS